MVYPPAYQQVLKGLPAVNYAARDIIYRPRNVRAHRVYGYSPVQQILMTVNIALRRQLWQLDYYAEGSIPDALIGVPQGWTPDQIKQFQDYWDQEFAGDLARRRRAKFVPGEAAARVHQTKEPEQKNDFDEWLARIVCFAFSVPPQWAVKAMNRATADNQSAQAEEEGLEPTKEWVKDLVDELLAEEFGSPDLELAWRDEDNDEKTEQAQFEARVKIGAATLNELRDSLGLDPFDTPAADRPMVLTATGYVPIEANVGGLTEDVQKTSVRANRQSETANASPQNPPRFGKQEHDKLCAPTAVGQMASQFTSYTKASPNDPDHPGWPAKTPGGLGGKFRPKDTGGGQTANENVHLAGDDSKGIQYDFPPYKGRGHTWVPTAVYNKYKWQDETVKVFKNWTSGQLEEPTLNDWSPEHDSYNEGVDDLLKEYLRTHSITSEQASPAQAREIVEEVLGSRDPRISALRQPILRQALRYLRVYGPERWEGGGDE